MDQAYHFTQLSYDFARLYRMVAPDPFWSGGCFPFVLSAHERPDRTMLTELYYIRLKYDPILAWLLVDEGDDLLGWIRTFRPALEPRWTTFQQHALFELYATKIEQRGYCFVEVFVDSEPFFERASFLYSDLFPVYQPSGIARQLVEDGLARTDAVSYAMIAFAIEELVGGS